MLYWQELHARFVKEGEINKGETQLFSYYHEVLLCSIHGVLIDMALIDFLITFPSISEKEL